MAGVGPVRSYRRQQQPGHLSGQRYETMSSKLFIFPAGVYVYTMQNTMVGDGGKFLERSYGCHI